MISTAALENLYISDANARKTDRDLDIEILADDLLAQGLTQNLAVVADPLLGTFGVVDGGRRLLALRRLDGEGRWSDRLPPKDAIPIHVEPAEAAREVSLSANTQRVDMNPVDEILAYRDIVDDYERLGLADPAARIERCARHFGKEVRFIEQRLRLAGLAPDILEALRARAIGMDAARAYAAVADQALQREVFAAQENVAAHGSGRHSVSAIKAMLARKLYRAADRWVIYAGIDRYLEAGGRVDRDLFMGVEADEVLLNTDLVDRLVRDRGEPEAAAIGQALGYKGGLLEGWAAETSVPPRPPAGHFIGYNRADRLSPEEKAGAILICRIAPDGSRLQPTEHVFLPVAQPAARAAGTVDGLGLLPAAAAARQRSIETEIERLSRIRRERVERRAVGLAIRSLPDSALVRRLFMPADHDKPVPPIQRDEGDGSYLVAIQIRVAPDEIDKHRIAAELEVEKEEGGPGARTDEDAAAFDGPAEEEARDSGDEAPLSTEPIAEPAE